MPVGSMEAMSAELDASPASSMAEARGKMSIPSPSIVLMSALMRRDPIKFADSQESAELAHPSAAGTDLGVVTPVGWASSIN